MSVRLSVPELVPWLRMMSRRPRLSVVSLRIQCRKKVEPLTPQVACALDSPPRQRITLNCRNHQQPPGRAKPKSRRILPRKDPDLNADSPGKLDQVAGSPALLDGGVE